MLLVDCSNCRRALELPPGAHSIRCAICHAVTRIADPRSLQPPPPPPQGFYSSTHQHQPYYPPPPQPFAAPSPYNHAPRGPPPAVHGRKRAVICGISYRNSRHELKGCINDAKCMKYLLVNKFNFPESSILMLTGTLFLIFDLSLSLFMLDFFCVFVLSAVLFGLRERERERELSFFLFAHMLLLFYIYSPVSEFRLLLNRS